ncbi:ZIP family metal transporter [Candidatus Campbellbacteria bacterium]|nr:MAG: ZIP family metal transporter [Candidatus Campbellbacteria bacterium]
MIIIITIATFLATLLGGLFALRLKDRLHLILGFSAGAVIGIVFFDLIPESIELGSAVYSASFMTTVMAVGFVLYLLLDRLFLVHGHDEHCAHEGRGKVGAGSLSLHSFLDGVGIGLAFQVSPVVGAIVAAAVLTHDFSDGINTVGFILKNGGDKKQALRWLFVDACAPVLGVLSTLFFSVQDTTLALFLALFSGFFLYIGASDLLPESHHAHPVKWTTFATVLGIGIMYGVIRLAGL